MPTATKQLGTMLLESCLRNRRATSSLTNGELQSEFQRQHRGTYRTYSRCATATLSEMQDLYCYCQGTYAAFGLPNAQGLCLHSANKDLRVVLLADKPNKLLMLLLRFALQTVQSAMYFRLELQPCYCSGTEYITRGA